jgi:hypothetical protein
MADLNKLVEEYKGLKVGSDRRGSLVIAIALCFKTKNEWREGHSPSYNAAQPRRLNLMNDPEVVGHMIQLQTDWTREMIIGKASQFKAKKGWEKGHSASYVAATRRGLLNDPEVTGHMVRGSRLTKWTRENIIEKASQFKTKNEWVKQHSASYAAAHKYGLLDDPEVTGHMNGLTKWTREMIIKEAYSFKTKSEWRSGHHASYGAARKRDLLSDPEVVGHMVCGVQHRRGGVTFGSHGARLEHIFAAEYVFPMYGKENVVHDKFLNGTTFRPDFLIESEKLVIEFDEVYHSSQKVEDGARQQEIEALGYTVVRFSEEDLRSYLKSEGKEDLLSRDKIVD